MTKKDDRSTIPSMTRSATKEKIIEAGIELFLEKGYNGAGLQEILRAAKVPKGSFYHFFDSKEAFGREALLHYSQAFKPLLQQYLVDSRDKPLARLEAFFDAMIHHFDQVVECKGGCLIGNFAQEMADTNERFREVIESVLSEWRGYFTTCLEEGQRIGEVSERIPADELAEVILNSWEGALLKMKVVRSVAPLQSFRKVLFELLTCP